MPQNSKSKDLTLREIAFSQSLGFKHFERSKAIEPFDRTQGKLLERLERLELVPAWVSDVPNVAGYKMTIRAGIASLRASISATLRLRLTAARH